MSDDYANASRRAVADCGAIDTKLPPVKDTALEELDAAISGLQVALDYCRGNAAQLQRIRRATGRLRMAATLRPELEPELQPLIDRLDDALDCIGWVNCDTVQGVQNGAKKIASDLGEGEA